MKVSNDVVSVAKVQRVPLHDVKKKNMIAAMHWFQSDFDVTYFQSELSSSKGIAFSSLGFKNKSTIDWLEGFFSLASLILSL